MKITKELKILELRQKQPNIQPVDIARALSVSREYVRQVLVHYGLPHGKRIYHWYCIKCRTPLDRGEIKHCRSCWKAILAERSYTKLTCEVCGKEFPRRRNLVRIAQKRGRKHIFCGKACQGRWFGINFGIGSVYQQQKQHHVAIRIR